VAARRGSAEQELFRQRSAQRGEAIIPMDRQHPVVFPVVLEHRIGPVTLEQAPQGEAVGRNLESKLRAL
jgi:hypothetical protein